MVSKKLIPFIFIFILISVPLSLVAADKPSLAVIDLETQADVSPIESMVVSDLLRIAIVNTGIYQVVRRKEMARILEEQSIQQTDCIETACAVKLGNSLAVQKILVGTITRLGKRYIINVRLYDVKKATVDHVARKHGSIEELDGATSSIADQITEAETYNKLSNGVATPFLWVGGKIADGAIFIGQGIRSGAYTTGRGIRTAAEATGRFSKNNYRSVVPGWAQIHRGDTFRGSLYAGMALFSLERYISERRAYVSAQEEYADLILPYILFQHGRIGLVMYQQIIADKNLAMNIHAEYTNASIIMLGAIWIWNLFDGIYFRPQIKQPTSSTAESFNFDLYVDSIPLENTYDNRINFALHTRF